MKSVLSLLFGIGLIASPIISPAQVGSTSRVSISTTGTQANSHCYDASISADGRYVAFASGASNLVPNDTNGREDIFVRDRFLSTTARVSVSSNGTQGNNDSGQPSISGDGRYVAFQSLSSNLITGDAGGLQDIFVHDRQTLVTSRISIWTRGPANGHSYQPSCSADGSFVAFVSHATNLTGLDSSGDPIDNNNQPDVFVYNRQTGGVVCSSRSQDPNGHTFSAPSHNPALWPSGTGVVFANGVNQRSLLYRDSHNENLNPVGLLDAHNPDGSCDFAAVSLGGRFVAFESLATNLVWQDSNSSADTFVLDRVLRQISRVSVATSGQQGNGLSGLPGISSDGRFVSFISEANNLVQADINGVRDIFVRDRQIGFTWILSSQSNGYSDNPAMASGGGSVVFQSFANNLVQGDTNGLIDVFVNDFRPFQVVPSSFTVTEGYDFSGPLSAILNSDDERLCILPDEDTMAATVDFIGNSPIQTPASMTFSFEGYINRTGCSQTLRLFDYDTSTFTVVDARMAPTDDTQVEATLTASAASHIAPGGGLLAQVRWMPLNDEDPTKDGWLHCIDYVHWSLN